MIFYIILLVIFTLIIFNSTSIFYKEDDNYNNIHFSAPLEGGEPFEYKGGNRKAVLFVHGYPGSPKMFYMAREYAINEGFDVFSPRLPGFSSAIDEFVKTNFSMWAKYITDYYLDIRDSYDKVYIVGHSMGGALTLKLCENLYSDKSKLPAAIAVVSAPVFLNSLKRGVRISSLLYFVRLIAMFTSYIPPKKPMKSKEFDQDGDTEWVGYRGHFPKQTLSLQMGLKKVKKNLHKIDVPCFLCQAEEDRTVSFKNIGYIKKHLSSEIIEMKTLSLKEWEHTKHSLFMYKSVVQPLWNNISNFFNRIEGS